MHRRRNLKKYRGGEGEGQDDDIEIKQDADIETEIINNIEITYQEPLKEDEEFKKQITIITTDYINFDNDTILRSGHYEDIFIAPVISSGAASTTNTSAEDNKYTDEFIPINIDDHKIKEYVPHIEAILFKISNNNDGILQGGSKLYNKCFKKKRGGADITTSSDLAQDLMTYCKTLHKKGMNSEDDIKSNNIIVNYQELTKFIQNNSKPINKKLIIDCYPYYDYKQCKKISKEIDNGEKLLTIPYNCFDYNEGVITAYQSDLLDNKEQYGQYENSFYNKNIQYFIKQQNDYINSLALWQKRTIQDYTRKYTSFQLYTYYVNKDPLFTTFRHIGDSFYPQIHRLYPEILSESNFDTWLQTDRKMDLEKPDDNGHYADICEYTLNEYQWGFVIKEFLEDITKIILRAPPIEYDICGYRGVGQHYIHGNASEYFDLGKSSSDTSDCSLSSKIKKLAKFVSYRFSSISFNYNASKSFYDKNKCDPDNGYYPSMYRTTLAKGCRVLFIATISAYYEEYEIITPRGAIFAFDKSISNPREYYALTDNNINKTYGICTNQAFATYNNILIKTPTYFEFLNSNFPAKWPNVKAELDNGNPLRMVFPDTIKAKNEKTRRIKLKQLFVDEQKIIDSNEKLPVNVPNYTATWYRMFYSPDARLKPATVIKIPPNSTEKPAPTCKTIQQDALISSSPGCARPTIPEYSKICIAPPVFDKAGIVRELASIGMQEHCW